MKNINHYPVVSGKTTDKWVGKISKTVVPFLINPEFNFSNVLGGGFLLNYKSTLFLVTAKHIIEKYASLKIQPYFLITYWDRSYDIISTKLLNELGNYWLNHQKYDISAISLHKIEEVLSNVVDIGGYPEKKINQTVGYPKKKEAVILGYPFGDTSNYVDASNSYFCQKMQGYIYDFDIDKIIFQIRDVQNKDLVIQNNKPGGLSGGPIIINDNKNGVLIGICSSTLSRTK